MTLREAFAQLIHKRGWYKDLGITAPAGASLAKRFRDGELISTDKMREVLLAAGFKVVKEEEWAYLPGGADPAQEKLEPRPFVERPDTFFADFIGWNHLHSHMYPEGSSLNDQMGYYDVYLQKLNYQQKLGGI